MEIRKLEGKERYDAYLLFNYCFHQRVELQESDVEKYSSATDEDWGAFDDDNHLMARIINNHYDFYFEYTLNNTISQILAFSILQLI